MTARADHAEGTVVDYGSRLRLGVVVPSGNVVAEPEIRAMLPEGVAHYVTRLALTGSSEAELARMVGDLDRATDLLADVDPDLIVFHCTAVTTYEPTRGGEITAGITRRSGVPATTTAEAIVAALQHLGVKRVALLTPYVAGVHAREIAFLEHHGFSVAASAALGIDTNAEMARLEPDRIYDFVVRNRATDADGYLVSCTALRTAGLVAPLEEALGRPVVTSNQAMVWHALRLAGLQDPVPHFGQLLRS